MVGANANISSLAQECKCQNLPAYQTPRICKTSDNKLVIKVHKKESIAFQKQHTASTTSVKNGKCAFKT